MASQALRGGDADDRGPAGHVEGLPEVRDGSIDALLREVIDAALTRRPRYGAHV